jgi:hypothetical protein
MSGEVLSANPFVHITSTKGVDLKTGQLIYNPEKNMGMGHVVRDICPAAPGGKDWNPSAFSPRTGMLYIPHNNLCMDHEGVEANYIAGTPYVGANVKMYPGPGGHRGEFTAWDVVAGREVWKIKENFPVWSGVVVTAGDLVFYGTMEGWFKAVNARTGEYTLYSDYAEANPPARIIDAVAKREVDVAIAWGALAAYFARRQKVPLDVVPVSPQIDLPFLPFMYDISMGVRRGDDAFREELEEILARRRSEIQGILDEYGVPRVDEGHSNRASD